MLVPSDCPQGILAVPFPKQCGSHLPVQPLLTGGGCECWELQLGMWSVWFNYLFIYFSSQLFCPLRFQDSPQACLWLLFWSILSFLILPFWDGLLSLPLLSLFLSFIFCPTSFQRQWAAFLGAQCHTPVFRNCFVEFTQLSTDLLMNLWERKWSPCPIPLPS